MSKSNLCLMDKAVTEREIFLVIKKEKHEEEKETLRKYAMEQRKRN